MLSICYYFMSVSFLLLVNSNYLLTSKTAHAFISFMAAKRSSEADTHIESATPKTVNSFISNYMAARKASESDTYIESTTTQISPENLFDDKRHVVSGLSSLTIILVSVLVCITITIILYTVYKHN